MNFNLKLKYFSRNQVVKNIKKIDCSAGSERSKKDRGINVIGSYSPLYKRESYWSQNVSQWSLGSLLHGEALVSYWSIIFPRPREP